MSPDPKKLLENRVGEEVNQCNALFSPEERFEGQNTL